MHNFLHQLPRQYGTKAKQATAAVFEGWLGVRVRIRVEWGGLHGHSVRQSKNKKES